MSAFAKFYRQNDLDPAVVTVKVGYYVTGAGPTAMRTFTTDYHAWMNLVGEYWFSRKTSSFVYWPNRLYDNTPQPDTEWLIDNRPSLSTLRRYGQAEPAPPTSHGDASEPAEGLGAAAESGPEGARRPA